MFFKTSLANSVFCMTIKVSIGELRACGDRVESKQRIKFEDKVIDIYIAKRLRLI